MSFGHTSREHLEPQKKALHFDDAQWNQHEWENQRKFSHENSICVRFM